MRNENELMIVIAFTYILYYTIRVCFQFQDCHLVHVPATKWSPQEYQHPHIYSWKASKVERMNFTMIPNLRGWKHGWMNILNFLKIISSGKQTHWLVIIQSNLRSDHIIQSKCNVLHARWLIRSKIAYPVYFLFCIFRWDSSISRNISSSVTQCVLNIISPPRLLSLPDLQSFSLSNRDPIWRFILIIMWKVDLGGCEMGVSWQFVTCDTT